MSDAATHFGGYAGEDPEVLFETDSHALAATDATPEAIAEELQAFYQDDVPV